MFDIGFAELLVCAIVALLVLGPERLPGTVRTVGRWIGRARHTVNQFTDQIDREIRAEDLKRRIEEELQKSGVNDVARQVKEALHAPLPPPLIGADHLRVSDDNPPENSIAPPASNAQANASLPAAVSHDDHDDVAPALRERRAAGQAIDDPVDEHEERPAHVALASTQAVATPVVAAPTPVTVTPSPVNPAQGNPPA